MERKELIETVVKSIVRWRPFALFALALLGLALRLDGLNWDQGNNFHPDERQILFRVTALSWPGSLAQFLDPANSPLNPHFFAYGSFPLYLLAITGNVLSHFFPDVTSLANLTLVGRIISAIFDCGTILLTGWLALALSEDTTPGRRYGWSLASFLLVTVITAAIFLIAMTCALLDRVNFIQQLRDQGDLVRGYLDLPYVRQFAGTIPYLYEIQNMLLWGMGVALGLVAFAGLLWLCWRGWKREVLLCPG